MDRRLVVLAVTALTTAALTACSGGSSTPAKHSAVTSPSVSSTPDPASTMPSAAELRAVLLTASDLPPTWSGTSHQGESPAAKNRAAFLACLRVKDAPSAKSAEVDSDIFVSADTSVSSTALAFRSTAVVRADVAAFRGKRAAGCFRTLVEQALGKQLPQGAKLARVDVSVVPGRPGSAVAATATSTLTVVVGGQRTNVYVNGAYLAHGFVEESIGLLSLGSPIDTAFQQKLIEALADRVSRI